MRVPSYEIYLVISLLTLIVSIVHENAIFAVVFMVISIMYSGKYLYYMFNDRN